MTQEEMMAAAAAKAYVRWTSSGVIEQLVLVAKNKAKTRMVMLALGRWTKIHYLFTVGGKKSDFRCAIVDPSLFTKEEQREAARKTAHFKEPAPKKPKQPIAEKRA